MENELLTKALTHNDIEAFRLLKKTDLHAHALLSSNRKVFNNFFSTKLSNIDKDNFYYMNAL